MLYSKIITFLSVKIREIRGSLLFIELCNNPTLGGGRGRFYFSKKGYREVLI